MTTSAPVRKVHDVPIIRPVRQPVTLPAPDPERWHTIEVPAVPVKEKEPARRCNQMS